jgi:hypothetical protein
MYQTAFAPVDVFLQKISGLVSALKSAAADVIVKIKGTINQAQNKALVILDMLFMVTSLLLIWDENRSSTPPGFQSPSLNGFDFVTDYK